MPAYRTKPTSSDPEDISGPCGCCPNHVGLARPRAVFAAQAVQPPKLGSKNRWQPKTALSNIGAAEQISQC